MAASKQQGLSEDQVHLITKALADPRRYQILKHLGDSTEALDCSAVLECAEVSPATLSHHMKELEIAGLIQVVRKGKFVSYLLRRDRLQAYLRQIRTDLI